LAGKLFDDCRNDLKRKGPEVHRGKSVGELPEEERPYFLPLQSERFKACRRRSAFVDSHSLIRTDNVRYSVPVEWVYRPCMIEVFVDRIQIFCDPQLVAVHKCCYIPGQFALEPIHYLKLLQRKPGNLDNARAFKGQPWIPTTATTNDNGEPKYIGNRISTKFSRLMKKARIQASKGTSFYTLRRTAATTAARYRDSFAVQRLLGHVDLTMATRYVQDVSEQTDRVIENSRRYFIGKGDVA
jgi:hypothetical protein